MVAHGGGPARRMDTTHLPPIRSRSCPTRVTTSPSGAIFFDLDIGPDNDELFDGQITVDTSDLSPDTTLTQTIPGGYLDVILKVDLFPYGD